MKYIQGHLLLKLHKFLKPLDSRFVEFPFLGRQFSTLVCAEEDIILVLFHLLDPYPLHLGGVLDQGEPLLITVF